MTVRGFIDHADSLGAAGRFGDGDVQWMTAGAGISHAEMFPCLAQTEENRLELFQIWLNLPRAKKMSPPHFKMFWGEDIPSIEADGVSAKLIAGSAPGFEKQALAPPPDSYASDPNSSLLVMTIKLEPRKCYTITGATGSGKIHRNLYFYADGSATVDGKKIVGRKRVKVDASADLRLEAGDQPVGVLVLQGRDLEERWFDDDD